MAQSAESACRSENIAISATSYLAGSRSVSRNDAGTCQGKWHETDTRCSGHVPAQKEDPGALAGATGTELESFWSWFEHNAKASHAASLLAQALAICPPDSRMLLLETALDTVRPGWPQSLLIDLMREARWWARNASRAECKAYCLASYERIPEADKRSFIAYVTGARHG